jgi:Rrf2 family protein
MKITALEEYGLRCLVQLAGAAPGVPVTARSIARKEGLSVEYVTQLLVRLRQAGLVTSVRGSKGGFLLAKPPESLTIGDVSRALDEPMLDRLCASFTGTRNTCVHEGGCGILAFWTDLSERLHGVLDRYTLADLSERMGRLPGSGVVGPASQVGVAPGSGVEV